MVFDRSEHESDEYDPEEEFRDPDSDSITIPEVPTENAGSDLRSELQSKFGEEERESPGPSVEDADVPSDLARDFWALVLVINGAVLAYALAVMFLVFEGAVTYSSYLLVAGLVLTVSAARRYRTAKRTDYGTPDGTDSDGPSNGDGENSDR